MDVLHIKQLNELFQILNLIEKDLNLKGLEPHWNNTTLDTHVPDNQDMLQMQLTSEVDKYLQEVAERCEMDVNYFDGQHTTTNTISHQQKVDSVELEIDEILELINHDTSEKSETNIEHYI